MIYYQQHVSIYVYCIHDIMIYVKFCRYIFICVMYLPAYPILQYLFWFKHGIDPNIYWCLAARILWQLAYPPVIKRGNWKSIGNGGFNRKITYKWSIFHCHVWLPEGTGIAREYAYGICKILLDGMESLQLDISTRHPSPEQWWHPILRNTRNLTSQIVSDHIPMVGLINISSPKSPKYIHYIVGSSPTIDVPSSKFT